MYPATLEPPKVSLNQLHAKCKARLSQVMVCRTCAKEGELGPQIEGDEIVKAFEFEKDRYIIFTPAESKAWEETPDPRIDIDVFVPAHRIDAVYWSKPYYLGPDGGDEEYGMLAEVLRLSDRVALAEWASRGRQLFVALRFCEGRIVLQQLLRQDEIRPIQEIPAPLSPPAEAKLHLALKLLDAQSVEEFRPEDYPDEVYSRQLAAIEEKKAGKAIVAPPLAGKRQVVDVIEALTKSLAERRPRKPARDEGASKRKPPKRAAK